MIGLNGSADDVATSKIYKGFQTIIPAKIRNEMDITLEDTLNWKIEDDVIVVKVKKQRSLNDLAQFAISLDEETDVVELKKKSGRGER